MTTEISRVLVRTYLSRRPKPQARYAVVWSLLLLTACTFAYWGDFLGLRWLWLATPERVFSRHEYWRLFTTIFIHADFGHLVGNTLVYAILSYLLSGYFGWRIYPVVALVMGAAVNMLSLLTYPPQQGLLGASGVVYWMAGFWVTIYFFVDKRFSLGGRCLRALGFSLAVFAPTSYDPAVSYRTHGFGFALGAAFGGLYYWKRRRFFRKAEVWAVEEENV